MSDVVITEPGVYYDLDEADYHQQHDWLSWSRMKYLLPPSTPAHFKAQIGKGEERKRHFDLGKVVHRLVLGEGASYEVVKALNKQKEPYDARDYVTVSAQADRDRIYEAGMVPILRRELDEAIAMAERVAAHPEALDLLSDGKPEVSLFWVDAETGVKCRARIDWLPNAANGQRLVVPDLKTADAADDRSFSMVSAKYAYYGQSEHYKDGIRACGLDDDPEFVFVVVEKAEPFEVVVHHFSQPGDIALAKAAVDHCRRLFAECSANDFWPGYAPGVHRNHLPDWLHAHMQEAKIA